MLGFARLPTLRTSGVRQIGVDKALQLMRMAERREGRVHGNATWLEQHEAAVRAIFLVRSLSGRDRWGYIRCFVVILSNRDFGASMTLDVHSRELRRLRRAPNPAVEYLALNLAVRFPLVRAEDDPMFDPNVEFAE